MLLSVRAQRRPARLRSAAPTHAAFSTVSDASFERCSYGQRTDDEARSPVMTYDAMEMMVWLSETIRWLGLDVWVWYPNVASDYSDPAVRRAGRAFFMDRRGRSPSQPAPRRRGRLALSSGVPVVNGLARGVLAERRVATSVARGCGVRTVGAQRSPDLAKPRSEGCTDPVERTLMDVCSLLRAPRHSRRDDAMPRGNGGTLDRPRRGKPTDTTHRVLPESSSRPIQGLMR